MNDRQNKILQAIVDEYVRTAEPVSSKSIVDRYDLGVSPATVRNDMVILEIDGYLRQPHTSAGRVPTEMGYAHYIQKMDGHGLKADCQKMRDAVLGAEDQEAAIRCIAKELVALTGDMAIAAFSRDRSFFTGMGSLLSKPDFQNLEVVQTISCLLDRFDEVVGGVFEQLEETPQVLIGKENPFGKETAAVVVKYRLSNGRIGMLGIVGPMRMDYSRNLGLMEEVIDILDNEQD